MSEQKFAISVEQLTNDDLSDLVSLFDAYRVFYKQRSDLEASRNYLEGQIAAAQTRFFLARNVADRSALGFVHLIPSSNTTAMLPIWYLEDLYVDPAARRRGVAESLMREAERFARSTGAERLTLATAHDNHAAQSLYRKMGYRQEDHFLYFHRMLTPATP